MRVHHVGFRIRGFYRLAQIGHRGEMIPNDAQQGLTILQFFARHGLAATCEAFGVSRRTLYRWKREFTQAAGPELGDPALAHHLPQPRQGQAAGPPAALVCAAGARAPQCLHHRTPDRPGPRQDAARPGPPGCARPP